MSLRRVALGFGLGLAVLGSAARAAAAQDPGSDFPPPRGLISFEGPTGLFLNPTAAVAPAGSLTAQVCATTQELAEGGSRTGTNALVSYSFTDWLEVGALADDFENDGRSPAFGPLVRVRLLAERDGVALPEVGVGYYAIEGVSEQRERVVFGAASKTLPVAGAGPLRSVGIHGGVRGNWRDSTDETEMVGYAGLDVELPYWVHLIGELSTDEDPFPHTPFAFGVQVRHPSGVGFSLSGMQPGASADIGLFIGIGINFAR